MNTFKRILLYAGMVISVIILIVCLAGIAGTWAINKPVTDTIVKVLDPVGAALQRVEGLSTTAAAGLAEVSAALDGAITQVRERGEQVADTNIILELTSKIVGEDVRPKIESAGDSIRAVYDTLGAIEEVLESINSIPFIAVDVPGGEEVAQLRTGMEDAAAAVQNLMDESQQKREETVSAAVDRVIQPLDRLNTRVGEVETRASDLAMRLGAAGEELSQVETKVRRWIDIVSIILTLFLAWLAFSQVAVFVLCRKLLQGKTS